MRLPALFTLLCLVTCLGAAPSWPAGLPKEVDYRKEYSELYYGLESQGARPSCLIFSVVTALEFEHYHKTGKMLQLSEDYVLYHAYLDRSLDPFKAVKELKGRDAGFNFSEIYGAIKEHGICSWDLMPTTVGAGSDDLAKPSEAALRDARTRQKLYYLRLGKPGDNRSTLLAAMQALKEGKALVLSTALPPSRFLNKTVLLDTQVANGFYHAVALVGYRNETGKLEDTQFIFRNSWGRTWGVNGFGFFSWNYLEKNLVDIIAVSSAR